MAHRRQQPPKLPDIHSIDSTAYQYNEVKWLESWYRRHLTDHRDEQTKRKIREKDEYIITADSILRKLEGMYTAINNISYRQHCIDMYACSQFYHEQLSIIERMIQKALDIYHNKAIKLSRDIENKRREHIDKLEDRAHRYLYDRNYISKNSQKLTNMEDYLRILKDKERNAVYLLENYYRYNLSLGYNIQDYGLIWVMKKMGIPRSYDDMPIFLRNDEKSFLIEVLRYITQKYSNWFRRQQLEKERYKLIKKSHEMNQTEIVSPLVCLGKISELTIKSQRIQDNVDSALKSISLNRDVMKQLIQKSSRVKATANEIVYEEATRKLRNLYSNRDIHRLSVERSSFTKGQFYKRKQNYSDIGELSRKIKQLEHWEQEQSKAIMMKLRLEFTKEEGSFDLSDGRMPTAVIGALFGWQLASREGERLNQQVLKRHSG